MEAGKMEEWDGGKVRWCSWKMKMEDGKMEECVRDGRWKDGRIG